MVALACGTKTYFQRGDDKATFKSVWAKPVLGGARLSVVEA
jgi:hypothetical protein